MQDKVGGNWMIGEVVDGKRRTKDNDQRKVDKPRKRGNRDSI
jgi:hypothetical protein